MAASGHLVLVSLAELVNGKELQPNKDNASRYGGHISLLQSVTNPRTQAKHILGGTDEGEIIFWDAR